MITKESLQFTNIVYDNKIKDSEKYVDRANKIISMFPEAKIHYTNSYWRNEITSGFTPEEWIKVKKDYLVLGLRRTFKFQDSGRSTDFIPPSHSTGCLSACQYCYHARRTTSSGYGGNPMSILLNHEEIWHHMKNHSRMLPKKQANQCDPIYWTYDIGNVNDVSIDAMISDAPAYLIKQAAEQEILKLSFATKTVNEESFLKLDPKGKTRIRYSLMPQEISKFVDIRTSKISDRIKSVNNLVDAGYEVHLNFSPVILYENCKADWLNLFKEIDDTLSDKAKRQLACEIIFLTHNRDLHKFNLDWNPVGESFLWNPKIQEPKNHKPDVIRYKGALKQKYVQAFCSDLNRLLPYCKIRYAF